MLFRSTVLRSGGKLYQNYTVPAFRITRGSKRKRTYQLPTTTYDEIFPPIRTKFTQNESYCIEFPTYILHTVDEPLKDAENVKSLMRKSARKRHFSFLISDPRVITRWSFK